MIQYSPRIVQNSDILNVTAMMTHQSNANTEEAFIHKWWRKEQRNARSEDTHQNQHNSDGNNERKPKLQKRHFHEQHKINYSPQPFLKVK